MLIIGITGPSGAGKGVLSNILSSLGMHVIDADMVYHDIITPPSPCIDELVCEFGSNILNSDGTLNRKSLSSLVFGEENKERLLLLNAITHKYVIQKIRDSVAMLTSQGEKHCVIDAPLLIEAGLCKDCDLTIAVLADKNTRLERISNRDGITVESAAMRIASQKPDEFYISNTDYAIYNNTEIEDMRCKIIELLRERKCDCI